MMASAVLRAPGPSRLGELNADVRDQITRIQVVRERRFLPGENSEHRPTEGLAAGRSQRLRSRHSAHA